MRSHILKISLLLVLVSPGYPQTKSAAVGAVCKPPVLRGFFMGQTVEEINTIIPTFKTAFNEKRQLETKPEFLSTRTKAGFVLLSDSDVFYQNPGERSVPNENFRDVHFYWHFLDGKLFFISVQYTEFEPPNLKGFVHQVVEKTNLPLQGWNFKDRDHAVLKCVGFDVDVWTGRYATRPEYADYPSVMITDTMADAEFERRKKAIELRKKNEERERWRRERERKKVFKP